MLFAGPQISLLDHYSHHNLLSALSDLASYAGETLCSETSSHAYQASESIPLITTSQVFHQVKFLGLQF